MLTLLDACKLATAVADDREASYVRGTDAKDYGRYTRWYRDSVDRVLAARQLTLTPEEQQMIYILAACGEACDYARDYVKAAPPSTIRRPCAASGTS